MAGAKSVLYRVVAELIEREAGGVEWRIEQDWEEFLSIVSGTSFDIARLPGARVVKSRRLHDVARLKLPSGREVYIKRYGGADRSSPKLWKLRGLKDRLGRKEGVLEKRGRLSFELASEVRRRGIATPRPLGYGAGKGVSYFLSESVAECTSLRRLFKPRPKVGLAGGKLACKNRKLWLKHLASFVHKVFEAGLDHYDLKPKNILIRFDDGKKLIEALEGKIVFEAPRLYLVDLDSCSLHDSLTVAQKVEMLSKLAIFPIQYRVGTLADRVVLLRELAQLDESIDPDKDGRGIERGALIRIREKALRRDRYATSDHTPYRRILGRKLQGFARRDMEEALFERLETICRGSDSGAEVKPQHTVVRLKGKSWVYVWRAYNRLFSRGVPTVQPLAAIGNWRGGELHLARVREIFSLEDFIEDSTDEERYEVVLSLASLFRRAVRMGLSRAFVEPRCVVVEYVRTPRVLLLPNRKLRAQVEVDVGAELSYLMSWVREILGKELSVLLRRQCLMWLGALLRE